MRGYTLMNVLDPADAQDVASKKYVDAANRAFIFDNNKYLAVGEVSMGGKRLEDVGTPLENFQATNKFYVLSFKENTRRNFCVGWRNRYERKFYYRLT